jgi:hypothetical protein
MQKRRIVLILFAVSVLLIVAIPSYISVEPITACDPIGHARPLCGWHNPEDMVALPDGRSVIVSEYGGLNGEKTGTLALLDLETETRHVLYSGGATQAAGDWGTSDCLEVTSEEFSPHGIHVSSRADGAMQLLAVQHGGRESVEMFEVIETPNGWALVWRGCVLPPDGSMLNDVAATPNGGFLITHMMTRGSSTAGMFVEYMKSSLFGANSGYVLEWRPNEGFRRLVSSEGAVPNGIEIAPDGETVFVNYSARGEIRRINRRSDEVEASNTALPPLDNATWAPDGRLLVAGTLADALSMMGCTNLETGSCPGAFAIIAIDPETLESETLYDGGPNTPSGAGTVGLHVSDGSLLIGTFAGDRIVRVTQ